MFEHKILVSVLREKQCNVLERSPSVVTLKTQITNDCSCIIVFHLQWILIKKQCIIQMRFGKLQEVRLQTPNLKDIFFYDGDIMNKTKLSSCFRACRCRAKGIRLGGMRRLMSEAHLKTRQISSVGSRPFSMLLHH